MFKTGAPKQTFHTLNGMRGIAAIAVTLMHLSHYMADLSPAIVSLAVDFFFVLSGFVIAYAYEDKLRAGLSRRDFLLARAIRLYPMYLVGLLLGIAAIWTYERPTDLPPFFGTIGFNLAMMPYPWIYRDPVPDLFPLNFPAWSLFFELLAYVIFAALAGKLNNRWLAVLVATGFAALVVTGAMQGTLDQGVWRLTWPGGLARVTFCFFAGVALFRLWCKRPTRIALHPFVLFVLLALPLVWRPAEGPFAWLYELAVITLWMPAIVWLGTGSVARGPWVRICIALGTVSYPLYIIHAPVWTAVRASFAWQGNEVLHAWGPWSGIALTLSLCAVSWLLATYVDYPIRRRLSLALLPRRDTPRATETESAKDGDPLSAP